MNLANRITLIRIILTPFFIASVIYGRNDIALVFFMIAIATDALDGFVARALNQKTVLGTILDPVADKLLLVSAYICLSLETGMPSWLRLPPYVPIVIISRDAIIVLGSVLIHVVRGELKVSPSAIGKITTFVQMLTIMCVLLEYRYSFVIWNAAVICTVLSGIDYMIKGSRTLSDGHHSLPKKV